MKGLTILGAMTLLGIASATAGKNLVVSGPQGATAYPLNSILEIDFQDESMAIITDDSRDLIPYDDIQTMFFNDGFVAIPELQATKSLYKSGTSIIASPDAMISIYNLTGIAVAHGSGILDIATLPEGIYMAVSQGKTLKFRR